MTETSSPKPPPRDPARAKAAREFAIEAARSLHDDKCEHVLVLDLQGRSQVTDFFVVATGSSDRQLRSAGEHVADLGEQREFTLFRSNLRESSQTWVLLDFVDVVVHVFSPEARAYYDLELLWGDAERVTWSRPASGPAQANPNGN